MNSRGFTGEYIGVREDYAAWCDSLSNLATRLVAELPASWYGWEPSNEFMRDLDILRDLVRERNEVLPPGRFTEQAARGAGESG